MCLIQLLGSLPQTARIDIPHTCYHNSTKYNRFRKADDRAKVTISAR